jgi:MscS family membrane protein
MDTSNSLFSYFFEWVEAQSWLPSFLSWEWMGNPLSHYALVLALLICVYVITRVLTTIISHHGKRITSKTKNQIDDVILTIMGRSIGFISVLVVLYFATLSLELDQASKRFIEVMVFILLILKITKELQHFLQFVLERYLKTSASHKRSFGRTMIPPLSRMGKFIIWSIATLLIISNLGYDIASLIAGLGLGGLAFALAAQETLSNTFGSISVLLDQPFKVGDYVKIGTEVEGTILEVGMRSTRIQTLDRNVVHVPNKIVASVAIENYTERNMYRVERELGFEYQTKAADLKRITKEMKKVLYKDADVDTESVRVNFLEFGDSGLLVRMAYYITDVSSYARILEIQERVHLKLHSAIEKMGASLAFPTQTIHLEQSGHVEGLAKATRALKKTPRTPKKNSKK